MPINNPISVVKYNVSRLKIDIVDISRIFAKGVTYKHRQKTV